MTDELEELPYCTYCHTSGHEAMNCPDCPVVHVTVDLMVPVYIKDPAQFVREHTDFPPEVDVTDVFQDDEPEFPNDVDPALHASWRETVESRADEGTPSETYPEWIRSQIETYEQIWRESARDRDRDSSEQYLQVLRREEEKLM